MTLPVSGDISFNGINVELGRTATAQLGLNDTVVRTLLGISTGAIDINTAHGKSARMVITPGQYEWYTQPSDGDHFFEYGYADPLIGSIPWWNTQGGGNQYQGPPINGFGSISTQTIPGTTYQVRAMYDRIDGSLGQYPLYLIVSNLSSPPSINRVNVDTYWPWVNLDLPATELASGALGGTVGYYKVYGLSSPNYESYVTLGNPKGVNSVDASSYTIITSGQYGDAYGTYLDGPTGFWFYSNGTSTIGSWATPTTTNIGSQYEIYFQDKSVVWDLQDSNNQALPFATWLPLTNGVQIYALYGGWGQTGWYEIRKAGTTYPFVSGNIQLGV